MRHRLFACLLATLVAAPASAKTLDVVASFTVLADVVKQVGGTHVRVRSLVGPNGDPHEFQPSPDDAKSLKGADVIVVSGQGLESWFERLAKAAGYRGKPVVASVGIKTLKISEGGKSTIDPHVWNSALNVVVWAANIERALITADPEDAADIRANAARFTQAVRDLNAYAHAKLDPVPAGRRKILTSHDAFGYFGQEYGVTFLSPIGVSTETEASAADVAKLIDQIRREKVTVYFFENSNNPRLVKQIAEATGAQPGGELYVESLSGPDGPAATYQAMFTYNVDKIAAALAR